MKLIDRIFQLEELNGGERCPTYMFRWTLFKFFGLFSIYLHHFVNDDWSQDMHDHPKRFISIGVKGQYTEETPRGVKIYKAPWLRTFPANHIHRIRLHAGDCWTLVIVLWRVREWGFWPKSGWMPWDKYHADAARNCP
jgi:hypothetical protein